MIALPKIRVAIAAAMGALVSLAAVTPAQAIIVGPRWDPLYGLPFVGADTNSTADDMWWSGRGEVFINDSCVLPGLGSGEQIVTGCGMRVQNSFIDLTVGQGGSLVETLDFSAATVQVFAAKFFDGQLVGIISDFFDPWVRGTASTFSVGDYDFTYAFSYAGALLYHASQVDFVEKHDHGHEDSDHFWNGVGNGHLTLACSSVPVQEDGLSCGFSDTYATVEFDRISPPAGIPEPQTYALMLLGLGAIGMTTRRRKHRQA
jgi:hypothetical protein